MSWRVTLVHGNDDVMEVLAASREESLAWVEAEEGRRGHSVEQLRKDFTLDLPGRVQWGANYHWANMEEDPNGTRA